MTAGNEPHVITVGDYAKNSLCFAESIVLTLNSLYDAGVPDIENAKQLAESLAVELRIWIEENC